MARLRVHTKTMTDGKEQGTNYRLAEQMIEATLAASESRNREFVVTTELKVKLFEDGSGLFIFKRPGTKEKLSIRFSEEGKPLQIYADFDGVEGVLVPDNPDERNDRLQEEYEEGFRAGQESKT